MRKFTLLIVMMLILCTALMADISQYYTFAPSTGTYTAITGTAVASALGDDVISTPVDIGFTFNYGLNSYTQVKIASNGYITLGTTPGSTLTNALTSTSYCPVVAPLWDDLHTGTATVQYLLEGTAPSRIFTVQYAAVKWNYSSTTSFDFQVKLYENGRIDMVYGPTASTPVSASASIGINMLPGGATNYWSVTPGAPATASNTAENTTIAAWPGANTVYAFNPPTPVPNDLAATALTGNLTPTQGAVSNYTVTVRNNGTAAQTNYSVKIMTGTTELASVAGPAIQPGIVAQVQVPWAPAATGPLTIFAKVVLAGDENAQNDNSNSLNVNVQASGTTAITIGDGSQTARLPMDFYYKNSLFETIYQAAEIGVGGMITGISFYNSFADDRQNMPTKIWLGATAQTDLSAGWIPSTALVQVFDGTVSYPIGQNTITITFTQPFAYGGTNLVLLVNRPMDTAYYSSSDYFLCQTVGSNRSRSVYNDVTVYDPANPGTVGTVSGQFPKTTLFLTAAGPDPVFGVAPESKNYGTVLMNQTASQPFSVFNMGGGSLTISSISVVGSPMFNLQNLPTLPITLNSGQNTTFTAQYAPTAAGNHTANINITDNLTRVTHTVALTGTCMDPTIYTSPYTQNFDTNVTIPNLPIDWQKLVQSTAGNVTTSTAAPHSAPNCVLLTNSSDAAAVLDLIAPPLANALPTNTMRVKFWAKGSAGYTLSVGVMTNPTDAATYTETQSVTLTAAWAEYIVGFQTYTGTGRYIAFKHGLGGTYRSIYVDDVMVEVIAANDLAALSVAGNTTPSVGIPSTYTVNLFNWGTVAQNTYQVKLMGAGDVELASVAGTTINPGASGTAAITWTPTTQGATTIYGKVVLTGDQNAVNDNSPVLNVAVQAAGSLVVTIGDGSQTARMPMDFFYKNSLNETLYLQTELNFMGMITGISLYNNFADDRQNMPTKVWLGTTELTDLSAGWIASTELTQVFDGNVSYPIGTNMVTITFPTPFLYLEGNLVVMFNRPMDTAYYSSADYFLAQTIGTNRARNIFSDTITYDPAAPPATGGTNNGQFAKTSFHVIPGGVGHLTGTVTGAGSQPLSDVTVQILNGASATTNAQGLYTIQNIIAGAYQVSYSRNGYITQTLNVNIPEDQTITQNVTLVQMATVTLSGMIVGSDAPTVGLPGAIINFTGYEDYSATTNAAGTFTITGVYANQTYDYTATFAGYQVGTGQAIVGATNLNMPNIILSEIAFSPRNVTAVESTDHNTANIVWLAPDPNTADVTQSFESATFPPTDWTRIITDNGAPNTNGVYPTWCRFGEVTVAEDVITPADGEYQAGFWWSYNHQDEWLITPQFNCPQGAALTFSTNVFQGSTNGDHYYVKASTDNGVTWTPLWDASALTGGWNHYDTPVTLDLNQFSGQQIKVAWHADDPASTSDGMWYVWFIDNVVVGNATMTLRFPESELLRQSAATKSKIAQPAITANLSLSRSTVEQPAAKLKSAPQTRHNSRSLVGYKVYRLVQGQEQNEATWTLLTPATITDVNFADAGWATLMENTYKWAVKAVYTNDVLSLAMFSNGLVKAAVEMGTLVGAVRNMQNQPIMGATITVGTLTATTSANGSYTLAVPAGTHSVACSATGYTSQTQDNIVVAAGQTVVCSFNLTPVDVQDDVVIAATVLKGNFPNPFNPQTSINYDLKDRSPIRIDIYNAKGQLIRTLVDEVKAAGHYTVVWNGMDNHGKPVASGVYSYRMQAGKYKSTQRMILMK